MPGPQLPQRSTPARQRLRWIVIGLLLLCSVVSQAIAQKPLRVGVPEYRHRATVQAEFQPVMEALAVQLGQPVTLRILPPEFLAAQYLAGELDLVLVGTQLNQYLRRKLPTPLPGPIATLRREYQGQALRLLAGTLLVRADAPSVKLDKLSESRLAIAEPAAPSGSIELTQQLAVRGFPPIPPERQVWARSHEDAIALLRKGLADMALVRSGVLESLIGAGLLAEGELVVVAPRQTPELPLAHSTHSFPEWAVLPAPDLDRDITRQLTVALLNLTVPRSNLRPGAQPVTGFDPPADYPRADLPPPPVGANVRSQGSVLAGGLGLALLLTALGWLIDRRRQQRQLAAAAANAKAARQLLDHLPVGLWQRDRDGRLRDVNARVRQVLGLSDGPMASTTDYASLFPENIAAQLVAADRDTLGSGGVCQRRVRLATPDGQLRELELFQVRTLDGARRPDGVISVAVERSAEALLDSTPLLTEYESLLGRVSAELVSASTHSVDAAIHRALAALGVASAADRAYLFMFNGDRSRADNTHEWCAPGIAPQRSELQDLAMAQDYPWLLAAMQQRDSVAIDDVGALPDHAASERQRLLAKGIRSLLIVPLLAGDKLVGFVGLDDVQGVRRWRTGERSLLRVVGEMLIHALLRLRAERSLGESVAYLEALLGALPDLLFVFDADGNYLDLRARDPDKLIRRNGQQIGLNVRETMPPAVTVQTLAALDRVFAGSTLERFDYTLQIDGRDATFAAELVPLDAGRVLAICHDISDRRRTEQALAASEARYRALVDHSQSLIFQLDGERRLQFLSRRALLLLGQLPQLLLGRHLLELVERDDHPALRDYLDRIAQRARAAEPDPTLDGGVELRFRLPDGQTRWLHVVMTPVTGAGAEADAGLVGNAVDITSRVDAHQQLRHESALNALLVRLAVTYIALPPERLPGMIRTSLEELARFVGADRGYVFHYNTEARTVSNSIEWCADGVTAQIDRLQTHAFDQFPELTERHFRGEIIEVPEVAVLRDAKTRGHLAAQDIRSLLTVPLMRGTACLGFVRLDWTRELHRCSAAEVQLLTVFAQMLVNAQLHAESADALEQQRRRLALIVDGTAAGTWIWWPQDGALEVNERWAAMLGYTLAELAPVDFETWRRLSHPDDLASAEQALGQHASGAAANYEARLRMRHRDGRWIWVLTRGRIVQRDDHGEVLIYAGTHQDISAQVAADERLRLAASVFTHSHEGILITDAESRIVEVNEAFTRITGYTRAEVIGQNPRLLKSGRHGPEFYREMWRALGSHGHWAGEVWNRRRNGEHYAEYLTLSTVPDARGLAVNYVALFSDITAQKQYQQRLERIAHYDALTGLPNRVLLADRLRQAMAQARRRRQQVAIAFIDLDGFKSVNDSHGHEVGDQFLRGVGQRMQQALREWDTVSRLGGDEFVAVMIDLPDREALQRLLERLADALGEPLQVGALRLPLSASIGVSFYPQAEDLDAEQLLRQADQAMYEAKHAGKGRICYFDADLDPSHRQRIDGLLRIREALRRAEFVLHYQPKVDLRGGRVRSAEALLRWQHPERGLLAPADFLPLLEGDPLTTLLGDWVLSQALHDQQHWRSAGIELGVSVNIAAQHLLRPGFVDGLQRLLTQYDTVPAFGLTLELIETRVIDNLDQASAVIGACHALGVGIALDDVGTDCSSLGYLTQLPLVELKIDQRFVRDMLIDPDDLAIIDGILSLGRTLGLGVVAEGVEARDQAEALLLLGCSQLQGYVLARPMPAEALPGWLQSWRADGAWLDRLPLPRERLPLLFTEAEVRGWTSDMAGYLRGEQETMPEPDPLRCRFGRWLQLLPDTGIAEDWLAMLIDSHEALHETARRLLAAGNAVALSDSLMVLDAASAQVRETLRAGQARSDIPALPALPDLLAPTSATRVESGR